MDVTVQDMMEARDRRAQRQQELLAEYRQTLLCFTLNIPGPEKDSPLIRQGFRLGQRRLRQGFLRLGVTPLHQEERLDFTGCEAFYVLPAGALEIKGMTADIEQADEVGRLYDMDVLRPDGSKVERQEIGLPERACLICGGEAKACARSRTHTVAALRARVDGILTQAVRQDKRQTVARLACQALLCEVLTTPKPGLVDRNNSGSHTDMNFFTFMDSADALAPYFRRMYLFGWDSAFDSPAALFKRLRLLGQEAESAMYAATRGVNTHKGLIFSLGLLSGALGAWRHEHPDQPIDTVTLLSLAAQMARSALDDFDRFADDTNGLHCYHLYHLTGIRGEAAQGFPAVAQTGLPTLRHHLAAGLSVNDASVLTLLAFLSTVIDTNMIRRGGLSQALSRRQEAQRLLSTITPDTLIPTLTALDQDYISNNLSPGGCADLLALSLFLVFIEG